MPGPSLINQENNIPRGAPNLARLFFHADPTTGIAKAATISELLALMTEIAPVTMFGTETAMLANTTLPVNYFAYVVDTNTLYIYNGPDPAEITNYTVVATGTGGGLGPESIGEGLVVEDDKVKLGDANFPAANPIDSVVRYLQINQGATFIIANEDEATLGLFAHLTTGGSRSIIRALNEGGTESISLQLDHITGAKFIDTRTIKKSIELGSADYSNFTDDSLVTKKFVEDLINDIDTGGGGAAQLRYRFNSSLYTEDEHLFQGPLTAMAAVKSYNITSFSFAVKLNDSSTTWIACADVAAVLSWIAVNVTTAPVTYWIRCLVNYGTSTGIGEVLITYS